MGAIGDITNMVGARIQEWRVGRKLKSHLMKDFPEGVVGLKNQATISKTIGKNIKERQPQKAVEYAKQQRIKIDKQKRYSRIPE